MLDAFKLKPYDLEPVYASWPDAPMFYGSLPNDGKHPKKAKDMPVDEWLRVIKEGCVERNVPKEYWHKVAQHYMGEKAKGRLDELKAVMAKVHGGNYRWNWEKFKIAMRNMGWNVDSSETESIKVQGKPSGLWWMPHHSSKKDEPQCEGSKDESEVKPELMAVSAPRPSPQKAASDSMLTATRSMTSPIIIPGQSSDENLCFGLIVTYPSIAITTVTHAPVWLLNACNALDFLSTEHPKVMSSLSAILITAGTIPSIPAISAGAGGALLASGAVQAVGAIALGVGSWLKA
ncbi:hypothetical protein F5050DRAFT_1870745, partial [Lentinula boryana]